MSYSDTYHTARWWIRLPDSAEKIQCLLCPHKCIIKQGFTGICKVRKNIEGKLFSMSYGHPVAMQIDPIEKKPLYHFHPGESIFSIGTFGCNLSCDFCQNWNISQTGYENGGNINYYSPQDIIHTCKKADVRMIAFTYNEPVVFAEYMIDIAELANKEGIKTVAVTNGYLCGELVSDIFSRIDAFNIDLKGFSDSFYRKYTGSSFSDIQKTMITLGSMGKHIELTTLLIPGLNDSEDDLRKEFKWIRDTLGSHTPLHLSAFYPGYKRLYHPSTKRESLIQARKLAMEIGLYYVYIGNVHDVDNSTYCPDCHALIVNRQNYQGRPEADNICQCGRLIDIINDKNRNSDK